MLWTCRGQGEGVWGWGGGGGLNGWVCVVADWSSIHSNPKPLALNPYRGASENRGP